MHELAAEEVSHAHAQQRYAHCHQVKMQSWLICKPNLAVSETSLQCNFNPFHYETHLYHHVQRLTIRTLHRIVQLVRKLHGIQGLLGCGRACWRIC